METFVIIILSILPLTTFYPTYKEWKPSKLPNVLAKAS